MNKNIMKSTFYNKKISKWDDMLLYSPAPRSRRRIIIKIIKQYVKEKKSLHDIGCANGLLLNIIQNKFNKLDLSGSDISNRTIENNKKLYSKINFFNIDISKEKLVLGKYDIITCSEVLEHVSEIETAIVNIWNMLKPDGIAIITIPKGKIYPIDAKVGHLHHFSDSEIFQKYFKIEKEIHWGFPFFNLYKILINLEPEYFNKNFAESDYNLTKKVFSYLIYILFYLNQPVLGNQMILVLRKTSNK